MVKDYHLRCSPTPRCTQDLAGIICGTCHFHGPVNSRNGFISPNRLQIRNVRKNWSSENPPLGDKKTPLHEIWGRKTLQCTYACTYVQPIQPMQTLVQAPSAPCRPCLTFRDLHKSVNNMSKVSKLSKVTIWVFIDPKMHTGPCWSGLGKVPLSWACRLQERILITKPAPDSSCAPKTGIDRPPH